MATQEAVRQDVIRRNRLMREIELLRNGQRDENDVVLAEANVAGEDVEAIDPTSPLSAKLQRNPWPPGYKPRILAFNGRSNPKKFSARYEAAVHSARGIAQPTPSLVNSSNSLGLLLEVSQSF